MQQDVILGLLQILEERHGIQNNIITSQLPVVSWHEYIQEPTIADAIMDRLTGGNKILLEKLFEIGRTIRQMPVSRSGVCFDKLFEIIQEIMFDPVLGNIPRIDRLGIQDHL